MTKRPPGARCAATLRKQRTCVRLRRKHEERVEDDEHERELAVDRNVGHVTDDDGDVGAAGLGAQLRDHRRRRIDAVHLDATRRERNRDPAGSDPELERATTRGELGEEVALPRRVRRHVPLVVDVGDALAVGFGPVVVHRPIEADPDERYR